MQLRRPTFSGPVSSRSEPKVLPRPWRRCCSAGNGCSNRPPQPQRENGRMKTFIMFTCKNMVAILLVSAFRQNSASPRQHSMSKGVDRRLSIPFSSPQDRVGTQRPPKKADQIRMHSTASLDCLPRGSAPSGPVGAKIYRYADMQIVFHFLNSPPPPRSIVCPYLHPQGIPIIAR